MTGNTAYFLLVYQCFHWLKLYYSIKWQGDINNELEKIWKEMVVS